MRTLGPDYLAYALLDVIVDQYFVVLETLSDELDALEDEVLDARSPDVQQRLRALRANLVHVRRASWPARDVLASITRNESPRFTADTRIFVRDAHDHALQVAELVESLRDVAVGLSDLYLGSLSKRMNEIMKVLTIISTLFIPLTFIAGVYGMNFKHIPELGWPYGYAYSLSLMGATALGLLLFFRRRKWL
jgi:magnesium transporter